MSMAQFAYLIFSHTNPTQVLRLAKAIRRSSRFAHIVIHHDISKSRLHVPDGAQVHLIPNPVAVEWADFSQVEMFLHSTAWILEHLAFDWLVVISGQDYPVEPLADFEARLETSGQDAFAEHFPALTAATWPKHTGERRYYFRYCRVPRIAHYYMLPESLKRRLNGAKSWFNDAQPFVTIRTGPRKIPTQVGLRRLRVPFNGDFVCYGGADWFNLNKKSVRKIHEFVIDHPRVVNHYRSTYLPSESFVPTILLNDPDLRVFNDSCRYVAWEGTSAASPRIIRASDLDKVFESRHPFARKFDENIDADVLDLLDARIETMQESDGRS